MPPPALSLPLSLSLPHSLGCLRRGNGFIKRSPRQPSQSDVAASLKRPCTKLRLLALACLLPFVRTGSAVISDLIIRRSRRSPATKSLPHPKYIYTLSRKWDPFKLRTALNAGDWTMQERVSIHRYFLSFMWRSSTRPECDSKELEAIREVETGAFSGVNSEIAVNF